MLTGLAVLNHICCSEPKFNPFQQFTDIETQIPFNQSSFQTATIAVGSVGCTLYELHILIISVYTVSKMALLQLSSNQFPTFNRDSLLKSVAHPLPRPRARLERPYFATFSILSNWEPIGKGRFPVSTIKFGMKKNSRLVKKTKSLEGQSTWKETCNLYVLFLVTSSGLQPNTSPRLHPGNWNQRLRPPSFPWP